MAELLPSLLDVVVLVFSVTSMLTVGLGYTLREIMDPLRDLRGVLLTLAANFVLVPLLAFAVARLLPINQAAEVGLMLVATAAGAPFLIKLTQLANGDTAFGAGVLVLLLAVTIVYMPIVVPRAAPEATVNTTSIAMPLVLTMLLPLGAGLLIDAHFERLADRLRPISNRASSIALVALVALTFLANFRDILGVFGTGAIAAAILVVGGSFALGYLLGGADPRKREVIALATAQRNVAAATVVATQSFDDPDVLVMVVVTSIVSMAILFPAAWALGRRQQRHAEAEHGSTAVSGKSPPA
jgi:bile acid:Na+ symporter, BASS family